MSSASRAEAAYMFRQLISPAYSVQGTASFNLETGTVMLNNGVEMPILGLGTYRLTAEETENSVAYALTHGYKLIDTAAAYGNEEAVGRGIKKSGVAREDVFLTTKLWPSDYGNAAAAIDTALEKLGVEYIDLLLLHQPWGDDFINAYKAMEVAVAEGKVRAIGLSNVYQSNFNKIIEIATIPPAVLQNERNPYFQQAEMMEYIAPFGTVMMDWFPLGGRGDNIVPTERQKSLFEEDEQLILSLSKATNGKTVLIDGDGTVIALYSAGHRLMDDESLGTVSETMRFIMQSEEYKQILQGKPYDKVIRYNSEPIMLLCQVVQTKNVK